MVRAVVGALHTFVAALLATQGLVWWTQAEVNSRWEHGFYGDVTTGGVQLLVLSLAVILFAVLEATVGVAFALGAPWAVHGIIAVSVTLMFVDWYPLNLFMALAAAAGVMELIPTLGLESEPEE